MAGESSQMLPASVLRQKVGLRPVPEDINGCRCRRTKCDNANCPCCKERYRCTSKCVCAECKNPNGVRGRSDSNTEPAGQGGTVLDLNNKLPSSNNETGQGGTSSMAGESTRKVGLPVPEDVNGCKCANRRCDSGRCVCVRERYRCTSKCQCNKCVNRYGRRGDPEPSSDRNNEPEQAGDTRGSDLNTEQGQGGTGGTSNAPGEAVLTTASSNMESEQADDASSMVGEPPQEPAAQPGVERGFDLNELP